MKKIGICEIGVYIPEIRVSNSSKKEKFNIDDIFLEDKIGIKYTSKKSNIEDTSDMCKNAYHDLKNKIKFNKNDIKCIVVVTQNPDNDGIPHVSAILHKTLELNEDCAVFDISLGCSGYVYGLSIIESFMMTNEIYCGLLFTCDPYSKIVNVEDKNTSLLFGDAATVTLINTNPLFISVGYKFNTRGLEYNTLYSKNRELIMDGRAVFNFSATQVPKQIISLLNIFNYNINDIDLFLFHQGSKFIIDTLTKRLGINKAKIPFNIENFGNTVSSSIPILLSENLNNNNNKILLISGFGVGLSWASAIFKRISL